MTVPNNKDKTHTTTTTARALRALISILKSFKITCNPFSKVACYFAFCLDGNITFKFSIMWMTFAPSIKNVKVLESITLNIS